MNRRIALLTTFAAFAVFAAPLVAGTGIAHATTTPANVPNDLRDDAGTDEARDLLVRVDEALNAIEYTYYSHSNYWSDRKGVYKVDCTGFVNRMVEDSNPEAYDKLRDRRDTDWPLAEDYYYLFRSIPYGESRYDWKRVKRARDLRPGDVLVWRYKEEPATKTTGHAMVVVSVPVRDARWSNVWRVRVADSARSGHSQDNRGSSGSGVGAGTILLKVDSTSGIPYKYAWTTAGIWHNEIWFAMARPTD